MWLLERAGGLRIPWRWGARRTKKELASPGSGGHRMPSQCKASELVELLERGDPDDFDRIMALLQADEVSDAAN